MRQCFLFIAWVIALCALLGSLYLSEGMHFPVCHLCWYQRIALYPLVILLWIGAYKNDMHCVRYALPFPILGFIFAMYQYAEQMIPGFSPIALCTPDVPCNHIDFIFAGFITLPLLSAVACGLILGLLLLSRLKEK